MSATVGLCGLGQMGLAIAEQLARTYPVLAYDTNPTRRDLADQITSVSTTDSPEALASTTVVLLSLPRPEVSHTVCCHLADLLPERSTVIETSTVLPNNAIACHEVLAEASISYVDAAILSGVSQMQNGRATLLVGATVDEPTADAVLQALSSSIERFGTTGAGMAAKVINNQVAHAVMIVLSEAAALAAATGVSLTSLVEMLSQPDGGLIRPLTHRLAERVVTANYDGGMPTDAARKDSMLVLAMGQQAGVPLFATQAAHTVYDLAVAAGSGRNDYAAVATLWEQWTGRSLGG